jgi:hypothetical protein
MQRFILHRELGLKHPGTVQVPADGEIGIVVVDALPVLPTLLALLERHVPSVLPPPRECYDALWLRHVILWPWRQRKIAQERCRCRGRLAVAATARARVDVVLGFLEPRRHLYGARGCGIVVVCAALTAADTTL